MITELMDKNILNELDASNFDAIAIQIFQLQYQNNELYRKYCSLIHKGLSNIKNISDIPFLPIQFFKNYIIKTGNWASETVFESSGTTDKNTSKHHVVSVIFYLEICKKNFENSYGNIEEYCFLCLLPSYLERNGSSLVEMASFFIQKSNFKQSGFYLDDFKKLKDQLIFNKENKIPTILLGVTFGLLDFSENFNVDFPELIIMETGGMKGRRKEMTRSEVHNILKTKFNVKSIHSEYGMTELFSQSYSKGEGVFEASPYQKVLIRSLTDPFEILENEKTGAINIIDLSNINTISFIQTDDVGIKNNQNTFEVYGRLDNSDIRGCNLMLS
jgi:Acyl-protein synthetase, LuxE